MKLSDLRPCDRCNQPHTSGSLHVVRVNVAVVLPGPGIRGLLQQFGSTAKGLAVAEAMAPDADEAVKEMPAHPPLLLCHECICGDVCLEELRERLAEKSDPQATAR